MKHLILLVLITATLMGCGSEQNSSLSDVTSPEDRPVSNVESFWLYEGNEEIKNPWTALEASELSYFPSAVSTSLQDYQWYTQGLSASLVPDQMSRHRSGKILQFKMGNSQDKYFSASFVHSLFDELKQASMNLGFLPSFELKGNVGDSVRVVVENIVSCYRVSSINDEIELVDGSKKSVEQVFTVSKPNFETENFLVNELNFGSEDFSKLPEVCKDASLASSIEVHLEVLKGDSKLLINFPGILVKKSVNQ